MLQYYTGVLEKAFTEDIYLLVERLYGRTIKVPLGVGIKAAEHWGEGTEIKLEATDKIEAYLSEGKEDLQSDMGNDTGGAGVGSQSVH